MTRDMSQVIPKNRSLTDATLQQYATELIDCIKIWGLSRPDAYRLSVIIKGTIQNLPPGVWPNPLEGTGLVGDKITNEGMIAVTDPIDAKISTKN